MTRIRLDHALVQRGLCASRSRAADAIRRGTVRVDGRPATKPGQSISDAERIEMDDPASGYVSRAALKLVAALDAFGYNPAGKICLDIGASTGGFSQVLLQRGAARVYAVDVGHGQLVSELAEDHRIVNLEKTNARDLSLDLIPDPPQAVTCDASFIGLRQVARQGLHLAASGAFCVLLVKPQFELSPAELGKGGIVKSASLAKATAERAATWLAEDMGWEDTQLAESPVLGQHGNREFLLGGVKP